MAFSIPRGLDQRFNLPNLLTYGRVLAVPVVVALPLLAGRNFPCAGPRSAFSSAAGISEFLDGYLARALSQQSSLGRMLDPIADELLVSAVLLMLVAGRSIAGYSLWAAIVILCREILVSGLREFLAGSRFRCRSAGWRNGRLFCSLSRSAFSSPAPPVKP